MLPTRSRRISSSPGVTSRGPKDLTNVSNLRDIHPFRFTYFRRESSEHLRARSRKVISGGTPRLTRYVPTWSASRGRVNSVFFLCVCKVSLLPQARIFRPTLNTAYAREHSQRMGDNLLPARILLDARATRVTA